MRSSRPALAADRDVLQIGIVRLEAPGGCDGLTKGGVDAPGGGVDEVGQGGDVGAEEFAALPILEQVADDGMLAREAA